MLFVTVFSSKSAITVIVAFLIIVYIKKITRERERAMHDFAHIYKITT
jgi:hypothetical protein